MDVSDTAQKQSISLLPKHYEIIKKALSEGRFRKISHMFQSLLDDYADPSKVLITLNPNTHFDIINDAIQYGPYNNPDHFISSIVIDYANRGKEHLKDFLVYILYPFLVIILLLQYSVAIDNVWLSIVGGIGTSIFWYATFRWTCLRKGIDPRTQWSEEKRKKFRNIMICLIIIILVIIIVLILLASKAGWDYSLLDLFENIKW